MEKKIVKCRFTPMPKSLFDKMPEIWVTLEGEDTEQFMFSYYPDEVSFSESEIVGRTIAECRNLFFNKDKRYLQS